MKKLIWKLYNDNMISLEVAHMLLRQILRIKLGLGLEETELAHTGNGMGFRRYEYILFTQRP